MVAFAPNASLGKPKLPENYIAAWHPWSYDRRVPIRSYRPGNADFEQYLSIETVAIALTLAILAYIASPELDGRCLDLIRPGETAAPARPCAPALPVHSNRTRRRSIAFRPPPDLDLGRLLKGQGEPAKHIRLGDFAEESGRGIGHFQIPRVGL